MVVEICPALYKLLCLCFADPGGNKDGAHQFRFTETETRGSSVNRLNVYVLRVLWVYFDYELC